MGFGELVTTLHIDEYNAKGETYSKFSGRAPDTVYPKLVTTQRKITTSNASKQSDPVNAAPAFVSIRPMGSAKENDPIDIERTLSYFSVSAEFKVI
jgi:hypothetical protein